MTAQSTAPGLTLDSVDVRFGGHMAMRDVTLAAPRGRLTGLIGPNGAGKTTTFNVCSGLLRPRTGTVRLDGADVTRVRPSVRARRGLGRTFQRFELCDSLTVAENVALSVESLRAADNPLRHLFRSAGERADIAGRTDESLRTCGLSELRGAQVGSLSTGQRRLVELARVCAGRYRLLLLDEPSSGLDHRETEHFGAILRDLVAAGVGILIVEHDMALVMSVCDHIYVLEFGQIVFDGTPAEVQTSPIVRAAYLGSDVHEVAP